MTVWLQQQEAVHRFATYLQWAIPGYVADAISDRGQTGDEQAEENDNELEEPEHLAMTTSDSSLIGGQLGATSHLVAKRPALTGMSVTSLVNGFGAGLSATSEQIHSLLPQVRHCIWKLAYGHYNRRNVFSL